MKELWLDGREIGDRKQLHDAVEEQLCPPDWYGRNIDALFDFLTDIQEETAVHIVNGDLLKNNLGIMYNALMNMLNRAETEQEHLKIYYE